jgi:hypothetical protein
VVPIVCVLRNQSIVAARVRDDFMMSATQFVRFRAFAIEGRDRRT